MYGDKHTNPNIAFFDALGSQYEAAYGANEGQISFVRDSLARLETDHAVDASLPSSTSPQFSILDIGAGTGVPASKMAAERGMQVHGFDFAPAMVALAQKNVPDGTFELAHTLDFATDHTFDAAFAMFATFGLQYAQMAELIRRCARWIRLGGYLFIGTFKLEAFDRDTTVWDERLYEEEEKEEEKLEKEASGERYGAARVRRKFFGQVRSMLVFSDAGWKRLLSEAGFEVVDTRLTPFQPPADCDWEPHYFITARRVQT